MDLVVGTLLCNPRGFGFLRPVRERDGEDRYVSGENMSSAMHGDLVVARMPPSLRPRPGQAGRKRERFHGRGRGASEPEIKVVSVLRRARTEIVGTLRQEGHVRVVIPDDPRLFRDVVVAQGDEGGAREDDKVAVRITVWPTRHISPAGEIIAVFGPRGQLEAERLSVVREFNLRMDFPPEVARAAEALPQHVEPSDLAGRQDLTGETIFTIDPPDARDFDDAVSLRRIADGGWELGVHIADVSHYVPPDGAIDLEARARGTSVYLPGQVLPMLPEKLSNGLCSLRPHEIRLTKTVRMKFSADGHLRGAEIFPSFIRSVRRFNYDEVQAVLDGGRLPEGEEPLAALLRTMNELAELLRQERRERGMLEMDIPEAHILTDEQGRTIGVELRRGNASHRLIEQFMLAANEAVANYLLQAQAAVHRARARRAGGEGDRGIPRHGARPRPHAAEPRHAPADSAVPRAHGRQAGSARAELPAAALDEDRAVRRRGQAALRHRRAALPALHLADPALPGPAGAPHPAGILVRPPARSGAPRRGGRRTCRPGRRARRRRSGPPTRPSARSPRGGCWSSSRSGRSR